MDQNVKPGLQPLPLGQPVNDAAKSAAAPAPPPTLDERVDEWVAAHPAGSTFDDKAKPVATTTEPEQPTEPTPDIPPGGETTEPIPPVATPPAETQPTPTLPLEEGKVAPKVEPPKPTAPQPVAFSLDAKYRFADNGPEWTGQQIVDGLRERQALIPKAQEADEFRQIFEMPAAQAKEVWPPTIAWMRNNPQQVRMFASCYDDPQKAQYLFACSQYWDSPEGQQLRAQSQPQQQQPQMQMSPEVEARFKQLETQNQQLLAAEKARRDGVAAQRLTHELNVAFERYPYLRDNPGMVQALIARAYWLNGGDDSENSKGVLDALEMERDLYDSKLAALNQAATIAQAAAAPTPAVPPLMGTAGASPQASSPRVAAPKKFTNIDDAVDDWMTNPPAQFR